mmetsp:Transcript_34921/g.113871  ORF Transcript_34921/g.113871 Transcript_34921/m.113871 type:complete len:222 (-) Transcript_34921:99-764(-)
MPEPPLIASSAVDGWTPYFLRASMPSVASSRCAEFSTLLIDLVASPAPTGPQCTTFFDQASMKTDASATSAGEPPTIEVTLPAAAPFGPPLTGASTKRIPRVASCAASALVCSGSPDVQSITSDPGCSGTWLSTSFTCAVVGRQRQTTLAAWSSSSVDAATVPCASACCSAFSAVRFHTRAGRPLCARERVCRCRARCAPIAPRPTKATCFSEEAIADGVC